MIKRTLLIENPAHLSTRHEQVVIELKKEEKEVHTLPMNEIGVIILNHPQISLTSQAQIVMMQHGICLVQCGNNGMPIGMMLPFEANSTFSQNVRYQLKASEPLKKQLWQQIVQAKIYNQAQLLEKYNIDPYPLKNLANNVLSGDKDNKEGHAAFHYWSKIFPEISDFIRERNGFYPNNLLNYGYAVLRAVTARAIVSSGLLLVLGIFHKNKYNPFCLADDLMEPYRVYVDEIVKNRVATEFRDQQFSVELTKENKVELLSILSMDVIIDEQTSPLFNAVQKTAASLLKCYRGEKKKLLLPKFQ